MNETDLRNFITGMLYSEQRLTEGCTVDQFMDELDYLTDMTDTEARRELHLNTGLD